jgi:hypothetical protein
MMRSEAEARSQTFNYTSREMTGTATILAAPPTL